ncbi:MAG TPA: hypothetical protein VGB52_12705 [Actinomycetota bacterium]
MKNITVTMDEETARWARLEAARREVSVSRLIRDVLRERMRSDEDYEAARARYFARGTKQLKKRGRYPARDEVHDRVGLR